MLRTLARFPVIERLRGALRHDVEQTLKPLRKEMRRLSTKVEQLEALVGTAAQRAANAEREASQAQWTLRLNASQHDRLAGLSEVLDARRIKAHIDASIGAAVVHTDPLHHIVVEQLLPDDVYALLLETIPPPVFFTCADPIKQDLVLPMLFGPAFPMRVWNFVDEVVARTIVRPAIMEKFHAQLQDHYDIVFGPSAREQANALPLSTSGGRLMLRRPGYRLSPHRDPKRSLLTCLLYLARPGDSDEYGTSLYRVSSDREAHYKQTYYPEQEGHGCELARKVPFKPNSMLVFLNSHGAHGAEIPTSAPPDVERFAYQFYIAPDNAALTQLLKSLPDERRFMWRNRNRVVPTDHHGPDTSE